MLPLLTCAHAARCVRACVPVASRAASSARGATTAATTGASPSSSVDPAEVNKFASASGQWWDPTGPFAPLHTLNVPRVRFIREAVAAHFGARTAAASPLAGLRAIDVGCGGGILSESLARLGATVVGVDAAPEGIAAARRHAARDPALARRLAYESSSAEAVAAEGRQFDLVVASEVLEHVTSPHDFVRTCAGLVNPGGILVASTINRTPAALALAVVFAEYVARIVPHGTHDHAKFVRPEELALAIESQSELRVCAARGITFTPTRNEWRLSDDLSVNYIVAAAKPR